jgi:3-dehydroquinate dehydratase/shikimate dehydrogenase
MTRLCASIFVRDAQQARADALRAVERGADMVELRLDALRDVLDEPPEQWKTDSAVVALAALVDDLAVPVLLTCRPAGEGGLTEADIEKRLTLLATVAHDVPTYVDLEWKTLHQAGGWPLAFLKLSGQRPEPTRIILSAHDYEGRPPNLISLFADMSESRADVVKLAWRARSIRDNIEAFELLRDAAKPTIALCLGEDGLISRVLARKFGAFLSFASIENGQGTADGQVPLEDMKRLYRWDSIIRSTRVFGVVGHPIGHSLSPHVHNAAFDAMELNGVYLPMLVNPGYESFKAFMESFLLFEPLQLSGLSITQPHKENALRYVRERGGRIDASADRIGAANTIRIDRENGEVRLEAFNTDAQALVDSLAEAVGGRESLRGMSVAVVGAGGTGRTAVAALAELGCELTVYNRTRARADALAAEFGENGSVRAASLSDLAGAKAGIFINATSVGLARGTGADADASPFGSAPPELGAGTVVLDVVYRPAQTRLLRDAASAGARTVGGEAMFLSQAAAQLRIWTGKTAPVDAMRAAFRAALSPG